MHRDDPDAPRRRRPENPDDPIPRRSGVNLDSVDSVSVSALVDRLGRLADKRMCEVCTALEVAVDCGGVVRGVVR